MGRYKQEILDQLAQAEFDYAECKIDKQEFLAKITACGVSLPQDIQEHMDNAEEARYEYKVSKHEDKF
jgi:hypothetical protein|tara:strand:- start:836 stop:1039 length:204 start_codon:yes stop_codon:yes gene_type:complete